MKVSILAFMLNEIDAIKKILPQIKKEWYDELLIVDGGSSDGSIEEARRQECAVYVQEKKGFGAAFSEGLKRLTGDIIVIFFLDGNCIPEKIPLLTEKIKEGYDISMISRYIKAARSFDDDPVTAFGNWMFTRLVNLLFGSRTTDLLYNYRAYRKDIINSLKIGTDDAWGTCIFIRSIKRGLKTIEIPGDEPLRIGGVRKMTPLRNGLIELSCILQEFILRRF
jgi:glycosyltransferase involved in cell wall biosynthesis